MDYRNFNPRGRGFRDEGRYRQERDFRREYGREPLEEREFGAGRWRQDDDYESRSERYSSGRYGDWAGRGDDDDWSRSRDDELRGARYRGAGIADAFGDFTPPPEESRAGRRYGADQDPTHRSPRYGEGRHDEPGRYMSDWRSDVARYGAWGGLPSAVGMREGEYRGRGPRGYRRSDQRILEDVCDCLSEDPYLDASDVEVTVKDSEVTLSGTVSSREEKRRAEDLVERLRGVADVHNRLRTKERGLLDKVADALQPQSKDATRAERSGSRL